MVRIGGGSTKFVLSDIWIVYTKSRKQLLLRKYLLYETGCSLAIFDPKLTGLKRQRFFGTLISLNMSVQRRKYGSPPKKVVPESIKGVL